ncbi:hypothetical protein D9758_009057 [Tetrapyrgos nigripes]|uniref:Uncharacterized protein n=1 Tax=Tetrapyrgos nigripes TaxID=182062 RepID=A0A8H5LL19_9AGAR|nr:hypothetical protein D9758_009057 [Tetrapyrgos nigripes]
MPEVAQPQPSQAVPRPQAAIHSSSTSIHVPSREKERARPGTGTIPSPSSLPSTSPSSSKPKPMLNLKMPLRRATGKAKVQSGNKGDEGVEDLGKERSEGDERDVHDDDSKGRTDVAAIGAGIARTVLETLREVAKYAPVPFLSESAGLALGVFDAVERAHGNREDLRTLAEECVNLVYIIKCAFDRENSLSNPSLNPDSSLKNRHQASEPEPEKLVIPEELKKDLEKVRDTLKPIEKFVKKQAQRNVVSRIVMGSKDAEDIKTFQRRVEQAMRAFSFKSNIEQRQILHGLANTSTLIKSKISPSSSSPLVASPLLPLESPQYPLSPQSLEPPKSPISIDNFSTTSTSPKPPKTVSFFENASLTNMAPGALTVNNVAGDWHQNLGQSPSHLYSQNPFQPVPVQYTDTGSGIDSNNNSNSHSTRPGIVLNSGNTWNTDVVNSGNRNVVWNCGNSGFGHGYGYRDEHNVNNDWTHGPPSLSGIGRPRHTTTTRPNVQRHSYHYQQQGVPVDRNPFSQSSVPLPSSSSSSSPLTHSPSTTSPSYTWPWKVAGNDWPPTGRDWDRDRDRHDDGSHSRSWSVTNSSGGGNPRLGNNARGRR